jgi:hypothetical protein
MNKNQKLIFDCSITIIILLIVLIGFTGYLLPIFQNPLQEKRCNDLKSLDYNTNLIKSKIGNNLSCQVTILKKEIWVTQDTYTALIINKMVKRDD